MTDPTSRQRGRPQMTRQKLKKKTDLWSKVPDWARHQDLLTDWLSVVMWRWRWPGWGSLKWDSQIWPWVLRDFDPRVTALARPRSNCTVNYRPVLSSERALKITNPQLCKENFKKEEKLVADHRWVPDTKTDWPTDSRKLTSTPTSTASASLTVPLNKQQTIQLISNPLFECWPIRGEIWKRIQN
jgi:hypothetical protein